jgi:hypothetical protein
MTESIWEVPAEAIERASYLAELGEDLAQLFYKDSERRKLIVEAFSTTDPLQYIRLQMLRVDLATKLAETDAHISVLTGRPNETADNLASELLAEREEVANQNGYRATQV